MSQLYHKIERISTYFSGKEGCGKKKNADRWKRGLTNGGKFIIIVGNKCLYDEKSEETSDIGGAVA